jgi:hypothetical protein
MVHTLRLDNYTPIPRKLVLGTNSSFGTESIKIERGAGWDGLNLTATWHIPGREEPLRVALLDGDTMDVPPEVTKEAKDGVLVLAGLAPGVQRASCNVEYLILEQAGVYGGTDAEPTPELAEQVLQAVQDARDAAKDADKSATNAKDIAQSVRTDADNGKFNGKDGAKGDKGDDGTTPQLKIGEDNLWHVSYDNGATWVSLGVKATGVAGKDGADGVTPHIGENGNWWFGDTDTGVSAKGIKGNPGPQGPPGEIPEDYPQIRKDVSQLKEDTTVLQKRQKMLVGSETGNPVSCDDAFAAPLCGLYVYGKSTQDGTPTPDAPVPIVSAGDGGSVVVTLSDGNGKTQTLTLQTPTGLPGIPVTSNGNYTDQNGRQWVCDEVDLERGVKVQRIGKVTPLSATDIFNKLANTEEVRIDNPFIRDRGRLPMLCNTFKLVPVTWGVDTPYIFSYAATGNASIAFRLPIGVYSETYFKEHPTTVYGILATPIETPLTPAEIAAYKALTAYAPDTVVQASDGAWVKLEYQRDVNIAIKNLKEEIGEKLDNFYISNAHVIKRTSTGSIGSHYLIKYSVNFDDYQIMKFVVPSTGKTYKIEFANSQSEVLKTVDTSGFVYGSEVLLSIPLTTSEIIVEVAYEVGVNLEITLYKKININAEDVAGAMQTSVYTNYNNLLRAENITDNVEIQQYAEVINDQYVSAYIPVVNGETIYCNYSLGTPVAWLCGEDKKRITSVTLPLSNNQVSRNVGYTIVTENAKWIRLSWKKDRQGIEGALFFSNKPIRFIENDVVIKKEYVPELNTGRLNNWWYMKNGDSLGDSLTGQGYFQSWTRRFFGLNDFKNHGVGGSKLSGEDIDSTRPSMWKDVRIDALSTTADFVTVLGGQNDGNVEIGDITKTNYDTNTYVGALNTIIDKIYNHCKDGVIIILCTPFYVPAEGDGERFVLLDEAVRGVAKLHGLPVADFGGLSTADKNTANLYWGDDKTHPTEKFYKDKIAPILINAMEQINPINWDDVNYYTES